MDRILQPILAPIHVGHSDTGHSGVTTAVVLQFWNVLHREARWNQISSSVIIPHNDSVRYSGPLAPFLPVMGLVPMQVQVGDSQVAMQCVNPCINTDLEPNFFIHFSLFMDG